MRIRNVLQEFETHLTPTDDEFAKAAFAKARGKSEWKRYGDDSRRLKISVSGIHLSDDTALEITINDQKIGHLILRGKSARFERETEKGEYVPPVAADQVLRVLWNGKIIMQGTYYAE